MPTLHIPSLWFNECLGILITGLSSAKVYQMGNLCENIAVSPHIKRCQSQHKVRSFKTG